MISGVVNHKSVNKQTPCGLSVRGKLTRDHIADLHMSHEPKQCEVKVVNVCFKSKGKVDHAPPEHRWARGAHLPLIAFEPVGG